MYDVERGNGTEDRCCVANAEQLQIVKRKTDEELNGDQRTEGPMEERSGTNTRRVKQEDASRIRTEFNWGRMRTDPGVGPERRGSRRWRNRALYQERGKCRVCRVRARIP